MRGKREGMEKRDTVDYGQVWDKNGISSEVVNFFIPYLLAKSSFTALPNLKQSSSDSLLFSAILLNTESSNFLNAFDFSNLSNVGIKNFRM